MCALTTSDPYELFRRDGFGAFTRHTHVSLGGAATGPLTGLTFGLKDIYDVAGHRTGFGNPDWFATHEPATKTASVATRLLEAGATMVGRTHTEEIAFSLTGENAHYGTPRNPAAPDRVPGGSSSGSAVAVAAGLVDFAIGSDTGGSVRGPASFCGIHGFRPTHGRIALDGVLPLAPSFDTCGWFARDGNLLARVGDVLLGATPRRPGRLLMAEDVFAHALPGVADALAPAIDQVRALLGEPIRVTVSAEGLHEWFEVFRTLQYGEIWDAHGEWVRQVRPHFGEQIAARFDAVARVDSAQIERMRSRREQIAARVDALLDGDAVMLLPSMPDVPPLLRAAPADTVEFRERALGMLCIAGLARTPQLSLPLATKDGLPLGLSLMASRGNDELLLEIARKLSGDQRQ